MGVKTLTTRDRPGQLKPDLFLSYLALSDGPQSREELLAMFWPGNASEGKTSALRQTVANLKKSYGEDIFSVNEPKRLGVDPAQVEIDALTFRTLVGQRRYAEALELYGSDFFAGLNAQDFSAGERLAAWLGETREGLRRLAAYAELEAAKEAFVAGNARGAAELAWQSYQRVDGTIDLDGWGTFESDALKERFELYYNLMRASPATFGPLIEQRLIQDAQMFDADDRPRLGADAAEAVAILRDHHGLVLGKSPPKIPVTTAQRASPQAAATEATPTLKGRRWVKPLTYGSVGLLLAAILVSLGLFRERAVPATTSLYANTFEAGLGGLFSESRESWRLIKGDEGQVLCGRNRSRETYTDLRGNRVFSGDVGATFDVMFQNFARNQEGVVTLNLSTGNNTFDGVFFQSNGTIELIRIENGVADVKGIRATASSVVDVNRWYTFRLERSGQTVSLFRGDDETPLLSRTVARPLPSGFLDFAVGNYDSSDDPNVTMCTDNVKVTRL